ncbi:bifunctional metallophosphatase/5'-nucleotidase [Chryseobacterium sp. SC28]|uniref:bifunctional metallophosphatase/5'-nucleotidase n=1 Tax=Chryseobacterium sp. SC28 TaxID=2268028 RepID=UPI000F6540FC|nr:bifunctional metallophosphatase/5'-nucleotidase [Chryseobacterium sp. SC28]RRQ46689.1 bifunctional metallophosphatase/5'-nucleotidase [Chryseobacterium sp. SC28]
MKLSIAFINDVHGYLEPHPELFYDNQKEYIAQAGGYARIKSIFQKIKSENPNSLFFDGGDTFHGMLPVVKSKGEVLIPILNALELSAMVGHWDFAYTPKHLLELGSRLHYPILGCNVYDENGKPFLSPYQILEIEQIKIGIIGICCNIIDKTMPEKFSEGITVTDGIEETRKCVAELQEKSVGLIILLSHNGFPQDVELLKNVSGIDVCLSAHTHNRMYEAAEVNGTVIIQCGCHGSFVGHLQLQVENDAVQNYSYELITADDSFAEEATLKALVADVLSPYEEMKEKIVGTSEQILHRYSGLSSSMDDFLLTAVNFATATEISFSNGWRYGAPIDKGNVTLWNLYQMVPMNPPITTTELSGHEIFEMLEENLERTFSAEPMHQMGGYVKRCSGLRILMRIENPPGFRIQEIYFQNQLLEKDRSYKVAFLTEQGVPKKYGKNRTETAITAVDAMLLYLEAHPKIEKAPASFLLV